MCDNWWIYWYDDYKIRGLNENQPLDDVGCHDGRMGSRYILNIKSKRHDMSDVVIHIPHSSKYIPSNVLDQFVLNDCDLNQELLKMTDHYTDELFLISSKACKIIKYPVSRLVVDPERFVDDEKEDMSKKGMGVIYTKTSGQSPLRRMLSDKEREFLLDTYYHPHHKQFLDLVQESLNSTGRSLIIDAHSFPSVALPYESKDSRPRPDICIGTDSFHTPDTLSAKVHDLFASFGYLVELNHPFEGAIVPFPFYQTDKRVKSIMIEVNRSLYMDEATGSKNENFSKIKNMINTFLAEIINIEIEI